MSGGDAMARSAGTRAPSAVRLQGADTTAWSQALRARTGGLSSNGRSWLGPLRRSGFESFERLGFPTVRDEDWRQTDVRHLAGNTFGLGAETARIDPDHRLDRADEDALERLMLHGIGSHRLVFVDGRFDPSRSEVTALPTGAIVTSLQQAAEANPELVEPQLGQLADASRHPFVALNTAMLADGVFVWLPDGAIVEAPVHALFYQTARPDAPRAAFPRNLVIAGRDSRLVVVETYAGRDSQDVETFTCPVTEMVVAEGAEVEHVKRQLESEVAHHIGILHGRQAGTSRLETHNVALGGRMARSEIAVDIAAEGCETLLYGLFMAHGRQHIDNRTRVVHSRPDCHSFERYKGILDDRASAVFEGRIFVDQVAQKTDAVQENSCLLLSRDAKIYSQPQLEIFADDVKCTHGATIGELDESQLFYLRARGIEPVEAHGILTYGYAHEIIENIAVTPLHDQLEQLIRQRVRASHARRASEAAAG